MPLEAVPFQAGEGVVDGRGARVDGERHHPAVGAEGGLTEIVQPGDRPEEPARRPRVGRPEADGAILRGGR